MEISCRIYRPRRPRESPLYRLALAHFEELLRIWPERTDGSRMRPPQRRRIEARVVGTPRAGELVFEGKPLDVKL